MARPGYQHHRPGVPPDPLTLWGCAHGSRPLLLFLDGSKKGGPGRAVSGAGTCNRLRKVLPLRTRTRYRSDTPVECAFLDQSGPL